MCILVHAKVHHDKTLSNEYEPIYTRIYIYHMPCSEVIACAFLLVVVVVIAAVVRPTGAVDAQITYVVH